MTSIRKIAVLSAIVPLILLVTREACAQTKPNFSGTWKQDGAHSSPARSGDVTLQITQRDSEFTVETFIVRKEPQHAVQRYTTDGRESVTTGVDGDTFRTKIVWRGGELIFTVVEDEKGETINSREVWRLDDNGTTLKRVRQSPKFKGERIIVYKRT